MTNFQLKYELSVVSDKIILRFLRAVFDKIMLHFLSDKFFYNKDSLG